MLVLFYRILGSGNKNLSHIVEVFIKVLSHGTELAEPETADHMVLLLNQMQSSLPPNVSLQPMSNSPCMPGPVDAIFALICDKIGACMVCNRDVVWHGQCCSC